VAGTINDDFTVDPQEAMRGVGVFCVGWLHSRVDIEVWPPGPEIANRWMDAPPLQAGGRLVGRADGVGASARPGSPRALRASSNDGAAAPRRQDYRSPRSALWGSANIMTGLGGDGLVEGSH
jgi:hypothetical protein